jgi:hypothetical protein
MLGACFSTLAGCVAMHDNRIHVILSAAKNLVIQRVKQTQILRLTPQNAITTESRNETEFAPALLIIRGHLARPLLKRLETDNTILVS